MSPRCRPSLPPRDRLDVSVTFSRGPFGLESLCLSPVTASPFSPPLAGSCPGLGVAPRACICVCIPVGVRVTLEE